MKTVDSYPTSKKRPAPMRDAVLKLLRENGPMKVQAIVDLLNGDKERHPCEAKSRTNVIRVLLCQGADAGHWERVEKGVYGPIQLPAD
jgi:hypothetical protein